MNLIRDFKRELRMTDWRICLLCGLIACLSCGVVLWLAGGASVYRQLCGECVVPIPAVWLFLRQGTALILGLSLGLIGGRQCSTSVRRRNRGIGWWLSGYISMLLWLLIFLCGWGEVLSLIILAWSIISFVIAIEWFAGESLLSAVLLLIGILWMIGSFGLTMRIILWN